MALADITRAGVAAAVREGRRLGREGFRERYGFGPATRYVVDGDTVLLEPKAVAAAAHAYDMGTPLRANDFSGGQSAANAALRRAGATVLDSQRLTVDGELAWRLEQWISVGRRQRDQTWLTAREVRERRLYGGASGIYADAAQTSHLSQPGVTVSVLHTGEHYPDDLGEQRLIYHYPDTSRGGRRDHNEIEATKRTGELELPIFVITEEAPAFARRLALGWVTDYSDSDKQFTIEFDQTRPDELAFEPNLDNDAPFELEQVHDERPASGRRVAGRKMFKRNVFLRYGAVCPLSEVTVSQMLEAAHLRDVQQHGTHDPRNGIPLNAGLHRAFDARLFAFDPDTLDVVTAPDGPTIHDMGIKTPTLRQLRNKPHRDALEWRIRDFQRRWQD